jgi:hypothetical protein
MYRFTLYFGEKALPGTWRAFVMPTFLKDCEAFASNDVMFTVEFKDHV